MYYSITFDNTNTWSDWRLIPSTPPMVVPPEPYTNYVEIPGRAEGPLDLSEALSDAPTYKNSEGSWDFLRESDGTPRHLLFDAVRKKLHNRQCRIRLEEDMLHYYIGRLTVQEMKTGRNGLGITIKYTIPPVRYNLDGTKDVNYP